MPRKLLGYLAAAFVVFFILKNPAGAAGTATHLGAGLANAATSISQFLTALGSR